MPNHRETRRVAVRDSRTATSPTGADALKGGSHKSLSVSESRSLRRSSDRYLKLLVAGSKGQPVSAVDYAAARDAVFQHPRAVEFAEELRAAFSPTGEADGDDNV